jgi:hypothetical protein
MLVAHETGAANVPLNAMVHVHLEGGAPDAERWLFLETFAGEPVDVTFDLAPWSNSHDTPVRMIPTVPLLPRTTYRLRKLAIPLPTGTDVVGTFTTGDSRDDTPPTGVDLGMVTHGVRAEEICDGFGHQAPECCSGDFPRAYRRIDFTVPAQTSEPVVYTLREGDRVLASDIVGDAYGIASGTGALTMESCTPAYHPWEVVFADRYVFTLTPRDVAGNEGPTSAEFVVAPESGCGCTIARDSRSRDALAAALLGVLLVLVTRTRAASPASPCLRVRDTL